MFLIASVVALFCMALAVVFLLSVISGDTSKIKGATVAGLYLTGTLVMIHLGWMVIWGAGLVFPWSFLARKYLPVGNNELEVLEVGAVLNSAIIFLLLSRKVIFKKETD